MSEHLMECLIEVLGHRQETLTRPTPLPSADRTCPWDLSDRISGQEHTSHTHQGHADTGAQGYNHTSTCRFWVKSYEIAFLCVYLTGCLRKQASPDSVLL